jgi:sterol O-acyltransferase
MIMKVHSYMTVNGHLQHVSKLSQALLDDLRKATAAAGGWEQAVRDAEAHRAELDALTTRSTEESTPSGTPAIPEGATTSYVDVPTAAALRQRLVAVSQSPPTKTPLEVEPVSSTRPHVLVDHPNAGISAMARDYSELEGELSSSGPYPVTYPNNLTMKNFAVYQLIPTLVYELEYPRTDRIRPVYVFEKTVATFGTFALLYTMTETFILPLTPSAGESFFRALLDLSLPFMIAYLLLFYIIFGTAYPSSSRRSDHIVQSVYVMALQSFPSKPNCISSPLH